MANRDILQANLDGINLPNTSVNLRTRSTAVTRMLGPVKCVAKRFNGGRLNSGSRFLPATRNFSRFFNGLCRLGTRRRPRGISCPGSPRFHGGFNPHNMVGSCTSKGVRSAKPLAHGHVRAISSRAISTTVSFVNQTIGTRGPFFM